MVYSPSPSADLGKLGVGSTAPIPGAAALAGDPAVDIEANTELGPSDAGLKTFLDMLEELSATLAALTQGADTVGAAGADESSEAYVPSFEDTPIESDSMRAVHRLSKRNLFTDAFRKLFGKLFDKKKGPKGGDSFLPLKRSD